MASSMLEVGTAADAILSGGPPRAWVGGTPLTQVWRGMDHCMLMFEMHRVKRSDPVSDPRIYVMEEHGSELIWLTGLNTRADHITSKHQDIHIRRR